MRKAILVAGLLVAAATPTFAQDKARQGLESFLKDALGPEDKLQKIERDEAMDATVTLRHMISQRSLHSR